MMDQQTAEMITVSDWTDIVVGVLAVLITVGIYVAYLAIIFAFLWAVWNWIVVPSIPMIAGAI